MVAPKRRRSPSGPDGRPHAGGAERGAGGAAASEQNAAARLIQARVSVNPPPKLNAGADRISALPDHLLLEILERLDLREAVRAGALSTRWRRLPKHLSRVDLDVARFQGATPLEAMDAFTGAARSVLAGVPLAESALKSLILGFYMLSPHLSTIGRLVQDVVSMGQTECLELCISVQYLSNTVGQRAEIGRQFMSFCRAYPVAFYWLTSLTLKRLEFGHSDITELISACSRLRRLILVVCRMVERSALKIDTPHSEIQELKFHCVGCTRIDLISVPKLRHVACTSLLSKNLPLRFGYVPELCRVIIISRAMAWQQPFALSECLSRSASNLSILQLHFEQQMIWIQPEHPKQLTAMFRNLTCVDLRGIFNECDLNWTLFILEAAPALEDIALSRHSCIETPEKSAEKTNVVWEPSKDFKHLNLKVLVMSGCEDEVKVTNYVRLVMEKAVGLLEIQLEGELPCWYCKATNLDRSKAEKASRRRIKKRLAHGSSSCVKIII